MRNYTILIATTKTNIYIKIRAILFNAVTSGLVVASSVAAGFSPRGPVHEWGARQDSVLLESPRQLLRGILIPSLCLAVAIQASAANAADALPLELHDGELGVTWQSLRNVGNLSSASVLVVLRETMRSHRPPDGSYGLMMSMGPGFCSELVLLRW